jgi:TP901 family phage tail tape measure protein
MAKQIKATDLFEKEDIFQGIRQSAEQAITTLEKFKGEAVEMAAVLKKSIQDSGFSDTKSIQKFIKDTKDLNNVKENTLKIEKEEAELRKIVAEANREESKAKKEAISLAEKEEKSRLKVEKATKQQNSAYSQLAAKTRDLKNQSKDLAAQMLKLEESGKRNSKEYRDLAKQYNNVTAAASRYDQELKQIDARVGDNFRNVGNYKSALSGLQNVMGNLGIAFGIGTIIQGATRSVIEFDQAIADLVSITGAGGQDLEFFKEQALTLGKEVEGGASAVIEAYKLIGSAKPELLENAEALNAVTESAITLSQASGMALPEAATALTDAMNQFGAPAEEASRFIDALANGALFGAAEIPQVTEALLKFGAVANTANVSLEESTGLIEALAEKGLKGAEAGTALRNVMLKLSAPDALPKEAQQRLEALGISFADLQDTSKPFSERLEALKPLLNDNAALVKVFGTENAVAATNLIANTDRIADLTEKMYTQGTASKQAEDRTQTLSHALTQLRGAWDEVILGFMNGSGASQVLVKGIQFLAANLGTIISIVGKLVVAWGAYKTLQLGLMAIEKARAFSFKEFGQQMLKQIPLTKQYAAAQKQAAAASTEAGDSAKAAGGAMSAVPWMAIIAVLIEVATAFYDIASGAKAAREQQEMTDAALARSEKTLGKITESNRKWYDEKIRLLDLEIRKRKAAGEDEQKLEKERVQREKEIASDAAKRLNYQENIRKKELSQILQQRDVVSKIQKDFAKYGSYTTVTPQQQKVLDSVTKQMGVQYATYQDQIKFLSSQATQITDEIVGLSDAQKAYNNIVDEQNVALTENNIKQEDNTNKINAKIPKIKEEEKYIRKKTEALERENEVRESLFDPEATAKAMLLDEERAVGIADMAVLEAEIALKRLEGTKDTKALAKAEEDLRKAREAQILAQLKLDLAQTDDVNEQDRLRKEAELKILNLGKKEVEIVKMTAEQRNEWVKFATDYFIQKSNERIAQLDKEIAAAEKQQDTLRELAANGNINARESLAENQRIIDEANRKKEQQERRKQMIELVSGVYQTYNQKVAANAENPLMETIRDTVLLQQFANTLMGNMPTFFDGTENTGKHGEGVDGKGGFHAILHPNERVVPKSLNEKIGSLSNEQLAKVAQEYQNGKLITGTQPMSAIDLSLLVNEMKDLKDVIRNKPETNIELGEITSSVMEIVKTTKQGNTLKTNRFKIRK